MKHYKSLIELSRVAGTPAPRIPLMNIVECNKVCSLGSEEFTGDFYMIGFKKFISGMFMYGRTRYDHDNGSMSFIKPRQALALNKLEFEENGFLIFIHEDYLTGHGLHNDIKKYGFFEYDANEALHLSPDEEQTMWDLYRKIEAEYNNNHDEYSRDIILGHVDTILKYSQRFYKRQFINRQNLSGNTVSKFNDVLTAYFDKGWLQEKGLPSVKQMATQLNISPGYLSDLLKQETGKTAIELIHLFLVSEAKNLLKGTNNNIAEVAYQLGFENLPYFSRLFKREVGLSPVQFKRNLVAN
ncbi:helix-turn-helix transcriptional regulator [Mucilaginibacter pallidiroseus]|uniref:Helix-turn-helix transcriptional regulator n=1 Tax=Mucilaginibacter pallidiroseus TaxID=2599295 RepID=A0A563UJL4_9SPHI|nr:AraC family transcriptional regulator [Mucilaginibacter pallidiroseus]TWR31564.1 helix-turn-helix transcriptional regulator [Mucilaginibacter pallidiroseus]